MIPSIKEIVKAQKWCKENDYYAYRIENTDNKIMIYYVDFEGNSKITWLT